MALLSAYASEDEYRVRVADSASGGGATLGDQLALASRLLERSLGLAAGAFNEHTATYWFDSHGGTVLWLRDRAGRAYFLQTITADGLGIDRGGDGSYGGYTLDLDDAWVRGLPENASLLSEPYVALELLPHIVGAAPTLWPEQVAGVRIAGTWGWASVPEAITDLTVHLTHDLREAHQGGATLEVPTLEAGGMRLSDGTWRLWRDIKRQYGRRMPGISF